jgi:hypothetical protein
MQFCRSLDAGIARRSFSEGGILDAGYWIIFVEDELL